MHLFKNRALAAVPMLIALTGGAALAGPIAVTNPSFETLPAAGLPNSAGALGVYSVDGIPGWNNSGASGQWQPGSVITTDDGATVAYTNDNTIWQTVLPVVSVGDVYTLTVDLGWRTDAGMFSSSADLLINGNKYFATGAPVLGGWAPFTVSYTGLAADAGSSITIELSRFGDGTQGDFDNVQLSDTSSANAPEPGTLLLTGLGLLGAGIRARVKRTA